MKAIIIKQVQYTTYIVFCFLLFTTQLYAQNEQDSIIRTLMSMTFDELANVRVILPNKVAQTASETPAIVTVITSEELKNMGARELTDVLQIVPGFELDKRFLGTVGVGIRGVKDPRFTSRLLILIDGIPYNHIFYGTSLNYGYDFDIENIERIEIIRGPGSALYGRNALSGVINIISKNGEQEKGLKLTAAAGNFQTYKGRIAYSYANDKFNAYFSVNKHQSNITDVTTTDDYGYEQTWGISQDNLQVNTKVAYKNLCFTGMYLKQNPRAGLMDTRAPSDNGYYQLHYKKALTKKMELTIKLFGHNERYKETIEFLKPNTQAQIPGTNLKYADIYPLGVYYTPSFDEYLYGGEIETQIELSANNTLFVGIQSDWHGVNDVVIDANVDMVTLAPLPKVDRYNQVRFEPGWLKNNGHKYNNTAVYLQDTWYILPTLCLTLGGRLDMDSEIGTVFNPRLGAVWNVMENMHVKLLYGSAYRAPAPSEQFQTMGYAIGNVNLKPERLQSFETSVGYKFKSMLSQVNFFYNQLENMIYAETILDVSKARTYYNLGKNISTGIEFENKLMIGKQFYTFMNYSFFISENTDDMNGEETTYSHVDVSPHKFTVGINTTFAKYFNLNTHLFYRSTMQKFTVYDSVTKLYREISHDKTGNFAVWNATFRCAHLIDHFELKASVYNILDAEYYSQDVQHTHQPRQNQRQFILSISYTL